MARHPIVSERLSKRLKGLFKGASKRVAGSRSRRGSRPTPISVKAATAKKPSASKSARTSSADQTGGSPDKSVKPNAFWSNLFWVRPWLLVMALWLTFVMMIAIALAGLSNPGREMVLEPVDNSMAGQPLSAPDAAAVSRLVPKDKKALPQRDPAATLPPVAAAERSMPAWPLLVMVMACAGGCMLMSNQGVLNAESRRGRRRGLTPPAGSQPVSPRSAGAPRATTKPRSVGRLMGGSKRQRRAKQRRLAAQRPGAQVMAFRPGQKLKNTSPQQRSVAANPVSFAVNHPANGEAAAAGSPATPPATTTPPAVTTVVPENETSPLDWKEGSLAHKLDVRQTRSIRSFL